MPNIATLLKSEIARVARKEVRSETEVLKKASSQYRSTIATLKRQIFVLEKQVKQMAKADGRQNREESAELATGRVRYSAKGLAAHRAKLGLSAKNYGALIGVSALTIYKWESGNVRPRQKQLQAIAVIRGIGKREAAARLEAQRA